MKIIYTRPKGLRGLLALIKGHGVHSYEVMGAICGSYLEPFSLSYKDDLYMAMRDCPYEVYRIHFTLKGLKYKTETQVS